MSQAPIETLASVILHLFELKMRENDPENAFHQLWYNKAVQQGVKREMEVQLAVAIAEVVTSQFGDLMDFASAKNPPPVENEYGFSNSDVVEVLVKAQASYGHLTAHPEQGRWESWGQISKGVVVAWRPLEDEDEAQT